ncbi:MAG: ABC transporter ATP-binding protein [Cyanobacteria bacterium P01_C01_bin.73]
MSLTLAQPAVRTTDSPIDVALTQVSKRFGKDTAVDTIDLDIRQGEFFSILGPSGCGKTTTLRLIAGFEAPSAGQVAIRGEAMNWTPPHRRPVNTVFQSYALFNHLSVRDNIAFGLKIQGCDTRQLNARVNEALALVKMEAFAPRFPKQLSGGQRQRVALARALVNRPAVMLLDEPLGALDLKLRKQMQVELSTLQRELGITFIMVTHDQEEALSLSDRIAVMNAGKIEQVGSPNEIYEFPKTPFVADFIGETNLMKAQVEQVKASALKAKTATGLSVITRQPEETALQATQSIYISVRPEKIRLSTTAPETNSGKAPVNCFQGKIQHTMYLGTHIHFEVELTSGDRVTVLRPNQGGQLPQQQTSVYAHWSPQDCLALTA